MPLANPAIIGLPAHKPTPGIPVAALVINGTNAPAPRAFKVGIRDASSAGTFAKLARAAI